MTAFYATINPWVLFYLALTILPVFWQSLSGSSSKLFKFCLLSFLWDFRSPTSSHVNHPKYKCLYSLFLLTKTPFQDTGNLPQFLSFPRSCHHPPSRNPLDSIALLTKQALARPPCSWQVPDFHWPPNLHSIPQRLIFPQHKAGKRDIGHDLWGEAEDTWDV